jgi:Aspartyl protease
LHSLEGQFEQRQILLPVAILSSRNPADLTFGSYSALFDTGATACGIGPRVIQDLKLRSHQKKPLSVATEMRMVDYYSFRVGFLQVDTSVQVASFPYVFGEISGFSWLEQKSFDVILGMDVLSQCDFEFHRNGQWKLKFG